MTDATRYTIHLEPKFDLLQLIDLEGETITLEQHQGYTIPRGVVHRTRAPERTAVLMVEKKSVKPTGDA
jgi:mannose-6-phosphate isomerase-like protein (cupin superfamily)